MRRVGEELPRATVAFDGAAPAKTLNAVLTDHAVAAVALTGCGLLLLQLLAFGHGRDQGIFTVVAQAMLRGEAPYRDAWDFKPPGIFFAYALAEAFWGPERYAIRILEVSAFASLVWAFAILSRRFVGSATAGILGAFLAVLGHVQLEFWHTAQPCSFAAVAMAWALVAATYDPAPGARRSLRQLAAWSAAGMLYGVAGLMKPPLGAGIVVSAAIAGAHCAAGQTRGWRRALAPPATMALGALVPLALVGAYLWSVDAWTDMWAAVFEFAPRYTALGWRTHSPVALVARAVHEWLVAFSVINTLGLLVLLALPASRPREREATLHVLGIVACVLLGVAAQAKFFLYHYDPALVLTALLAGWGIWKLWCLVQPRPFAMALVVGLLVVSLAAQPSLPTSHVRSFWERARLRAAAWLEPSDHAATNEEALASLGDVHAGMNRRLAEWLQRETSPDERVYIWGFEPDVYARAQRRAATRFIYNVPQRVDWAQQARAALMRDLRVHRPTIIVVEHGDRIPWVTGAPSDSAEALDEFPDLATLIRDHFQSVAVIDRFDVYRRVPSPPRS